MRLLILIALIALSPLLAAGQARTAERIVTIPFSRLSANDPEGSTRIVINGSIGTPCTVGVTAVLAVKLNGVYICTDLTSGGAGGAPINATFITQTPSGTLTAEQALSAMATGILKGNTGTGVVTIAVAGVDYLDPAGSGSQLTALNASQLTTGTVPDSRFPAVLPALSGINLTALNASNLGSGTVPDARFPAALPAVSGANLTGLNASNLAIGTLPDARFPATLPAVSGVNLTSLNASNITGGTVAPARLGIGSGGSTKFLREDSTWQVIPGGGDALTASPLSQFAATTSAQLAGVLTNETGSGVAVFSDNAVLVTPTIANFVNMGHDHTSASMGGQLTDAALSGVVGASKGGTGNAFFAVSGPAASIKTFTFPNATANVLTDAATVTIAQGGTGQTTATAAFNALDPLTTKGDVLSHDGTNSVRLGVGANGLCVKANSATATGLEWGTCGAGTGDVVGPASASDNAIVRFDTVTGKLVQNSGVTIDDSANLSTTGSITTGSGGTEAGVIELSEGTAPALVANTVQHAAVADAPAAGSRYEWGAAPSTGFLLATDTAGVMPVTHVGFTGTGNVARAADSIFTGSLQIPNGAAPTTDAFGEIAGDNNAWAASRGALQFFDGTANTYLVGVLASDVPTNGQVPTWNTGGTVTWESPSGSGGDVTDVGDCTSGACFSSAGTGTVLTFRNATSGTVALQTVTGALGTVTLSLPAATDTLLGRATTDTLTNKTLDVEGTGNSLTTVGFIEFVTAGANAGTAGPMLDVPATNGPVAAVIAGTNTLYGVLDFDAATDESIQGSLVLPDDWTGSIDFFVDWQAAATTGDVVFALQTACVAVDETSDPAFNTAQTVTDTALATTNRRNVATITPVTMTGCAAGERLHFKFFRDADNGSDTMTGDARVKSLLFKLRRTQ